MFFISKSKGYSISSIPFDGNKDKTSYYLLQKSLRLISYGLLGVAYSLVGVFLPLLVTSTLIRTDSITYIPDTPLLLLVCVHLLVLFTSLKKIAMSLYTFFIFCFLKNNKLTVRYAEDITNYRGKIKLAPDISARRVLVTKEKG